MSDISLFTVDPKTRKVSFALKPKLIYGMEKLIQIILINLFTSPDGRDVLDPAIGGGIMDLIGDNIDIDNKSAVFAVVAEKIKKTEREIISSQIGVNCPNTEKLREIQIVDIEAGMNDNGTYVNVKLRIVNTAGQLTDIMV